MEARGINFIRKEHTNVIKGVALILMFIHHFFTFPDWYIDEVSYPYLVWFAEFFSTPSKICVPIFAFITGYCYYYTGEKKFGYSLKKSTDLWINYVFTYVLLLLFAVLVCHYVVSIPKIALETIAVYNDIMIFAWYVTFYIMAIFILPLYSKLAEKSAVIAFASAVVLPLFLSNMAKTVSHTYLGGVVYDLLCQLKWFAVVASGYIFAQKRIFEEMSQGIKAQNVCVRFLIYIAFVLGAILARGIDTGYDWLYAPMFIFGLVKLMDVISYKFLNRILEAIGKYSLSMWFVHGVFFNPCKEFTQKILYFPHNPILVLLWGLLMCYGISYVLMIPVGYITKWKNWLLNKIFSPVAVDKCESVGE